MTADDQLKSLSRRCERILNEADLKAKLEKSAKTGQPLRIKFGMDPTAPDVTLGHAVPMKIIRQFQDWGHKAVLIIGDYTARVGDPSGRNATRPVLSGEEIDRNAKTYVDQVGKILLMDEQHLEVRFNSEWLGKMSMIDVIKLLARKSVAQLLQREDFANRFAAKVDIRLHELFYPLLQGWDSVCVNADVEMGGSDQLFNNLVGREFQQEQGGEGQVVIVTPLLVGTDGAIKMSKSKGNYIAITDPPSGQDGMFGKIMSLPDHLMESYYTLLTDLPPEQFKRQIATNPRDAKIELAKYVITWLHSEQAALAASDEFQKVFVNKGVPDEMPEFTIEPGAHKLPQLLVKAGLASSGSDAIRKIKEGAVSLDGERQSDFKAEMTISQPTVLKLGRRFARLLPS